LEYVIRQVDMAMDKIIRFISSEEQKQLIEALNSICQSIQWKTGKESVHLKKRQRMGHLSSSASLHDYEKIISGLVTDNNNILYLYEFRGSYYYAVRGFDGETEWLVIFGPDGIMETAFPPENMDEYLNKRGFLFMGKIKEVLKWT